jgi:hypothetical protein
MVCLLGFVSSRLFFSLLVSFFSFLGFFSRTSALLVMFHSDPTAADSADGNL